MTVTGSREALRECPFCGRRPTGIAVSQQFAPVCDVVCGCGGSMNSCNDEADAIEAWNTRASPDPAGETLTMEEIATTLIETRDSLFIRVVDMTEDEITNTFATAILSLIQSKMVQPRIATKPATSRTAAPVCELEGEG